MTLAKDSIVFVRCCSFFGWRRDGCLMQLMASTRTDALCWIERGDSFRPCFRPNPGGTVRLTRRGSPAPAFNLLVSMRDDELEALRSFSNTPSYSSLIQFVGFGTALLPTLYGTDHAPKLNVALSVAERWRLMRENH